MRSKVGKGQRLEKLEKGTLRYKVGKGYIKVKG